MPSGKVYLIGAGPGDPGLITVRGLGLLQRAEVVVHDRLVDGRLLEQAAPGAEMVYVGKAPGRRAMEQAMPSTTSWSTALAWASWWRV